MYRNYVFDFYGTLADVCTDEGAPELWEKMSEIYGALGAVYGARELQGEFRRLEREERERRFEGYCHGESGSEDVRLFARDGLQVSGGERDRLKTEDVEPDLTKVFGLLYHGKNVFCDAAQARMTAIVFRALSRKFLRVYDGVEEFLEKLRKRGKRVYLLSNAQADFTRPEIEMLGLAHYFDGIMLSSEQGCKKPSPVFFRRLLEQYGLEPSESIMIGNDEAADIAGARNVGMDTLYIHTEISPKEYGNVLATYRVMDGDFRKIGGLILKE
ncbi:MAG: HAD family hydrolase [Blautia sp.]|nr:HAD family hydrolase [Blautia sp.]